MGQVRGPARGGRSGDGRRGRPGPGGGSGGAGAGDARTLAPRDDPLGVARGEVPVAGVAHGRLGARLL
ncbi:MAG TPA: hypothetical protein DHW14_03780 [Clostridiales bacterium]|nr:hypothetical protein [Clostridiales bacterium]